MLSAFLRDRSGLQSAEEYKSRATYCTRRIRKNRKLDGTQIPPARSGSYKTREVKTVGSLYLEAERSWAHALETQLSHPRNRHQVLSKFRRAIKLATTANKLSGSTESNEGQIYLSLLKADLHVYQAQWEKAADELSIAKLGLSQASGPEFSSYVSAKVDPELRLSLVQLGYDRNCDLLDQARTRCESSNQDSNVMAIDVEKVDQIQFLQFEAQVPYQELGILIFRAQSDPTVENWDACWTTAANIRADLESDEGGQDLDIIITYAKYEMLKCQINQLSNTTNLKDLALMAVNSEQMAELPGVHRTPELVTDLTTMSKYFKALECITASEMDITKQEKLCLAVRAHDELHVLKLSDEYALPVNNKKLHALKKRVHEHVSHLYGINVIYKQVGRRSNVQGSLASNLSFYQNKRDMLVADLEVEDFLPVALKPVFYDVAYALAVNDTPLTQESTSMKCESPEGAHPETNAPEQDGKKRFFGIF